MVLPTKFSDVLNYPNLLYGYESHDPETGKLVPGYKRPKLSEPEAKLGDGRTLTPLEDLKPSERPPLMPPPDGDKIAWERSGHTVHA